MRSVSRRPAARASGSLRARRRRHRSPPWTCGMVRQRPPPQTNRHGGAPSGAPEGRFVGEGDTMSQIRNVLALLLALTLAFALAQGDDQGQSEAGAMASEFDFLSLELVAEGFVSPVTLTAPAGDDRLFLVDRVGMVYVISQAGEMCETPFLDVSDKLVDLSEDYDERGQLGCAFPPTFAVNGRAYACYSAPLREGAPEGGTHTAILAGSPLAEDGSILDPATDRPLLQVAQRQGNHNGGQLLFDDDDFLNLGLGDGGAANDGADGHPPMGNGQDVTTLLG